VGEALRARHLRAAARGGRPQGGEFAALTLIWVYRRPGFLLFSSTRHRQEVHPPSSGRVHWCRLSLGDVYPVERSKGCHDPPVGHLERLLG